MDLEIRPVITDEEFDDFVRCDAAGFAYEPKPDDVEEARAFLERDRTMAAFEGGRVVGASGNLTLQLTVPGPFAVPTAGVTWVAVLPTHRRRGVLSAMMGRLLADAREHGEPLAALLASESVIYGRFGFGLATSAASYEIERRHAAFARAPDAPGRFTLLETPDAEVVLRDVFDHGRAACPGQVTRSEAWWHAHLRDPERSRGGGERQFHVVHERSPGEFDGYVTYRYHHRWEGVPDHTVEVLDLVALEPDTRLALLGFCVDLDLASRLRLASFPLDEPLRWALADPRRLRTTAVNDVLWVRLVDIPAALEARAYGVDARVVLEVDDAFLPENRGRYELVTGPAGAECRPTDAAPDLALGVADLGAVYLGGVRLAALAAAGRVRELVPGALARADAVFVTDRPPYCSTDF